ncbi:hypothetical protein [Flavobacterium pedocola]
MKTKAFLLFSFLLSNFIFGQNEYLNLVPIKGKVKSVETFKVIGENSTEGKILIEASVYDKTNRLISKKTNNQRGSTKLEKNIYKQDLTITYECRCADINDFITHFVIRDKAELKNSNGAGTGNAPNKFATYKYLDKSGNIVTSSRFSESGYKLSEIKNTFNKQNKITGVKMFDFDDTQTIDESYEYDKNGNLTKRVTKNLKHPITITDLYKYDESNFQYESKSYNDTVLKTHYTYAKTKSLNKEDVFEYDMLKKEKSTNTETFFNTEKKVIQTNEYSIIGTSTRKKEKKYDENGFLISEGLFENNVNFITHQLEYVFDAKKKWIELTVTESYPNQKEKKESKSRYIRKIEYLK